MPKPDFLNQDGAKAPANTDPTPPKQPTGPMKDLIPGSGTGDLPKADPPKRDGMLPGSEP